MMTSGGGRGVLTAETDSKLAKDNDIAYCAFDIPHSMGTLYLVSLHSHPRYLSVSSTLAFLVTLSTWVENLVEGVVAVSINTATL